MDLMVTTLAREDGLEAALAVLVQRDLVCRMIRPVPALARVALPALVMGREERAVLEECLGDEHPCAGWVEYRPTRREMPSGEAQEFSEDIFGTARIVTLQPCVADDTKIRVIADLSNDIGPVLPYLNAVVDNASYSGNGPSLSFMDGERMIVLRPRSISIAKADEIVDAWLCLERYRQTINDTWSRRAGIEPSFEARSKPNVIELIRRLPGTNCGMCGEMTCMAFAVKVCSGKAAIVECKPAFESTDSASRRALLEACAGMGIPVGSSFREV